MKVKHFDFPTFEEWKKKNCEWESRLGEYNIEIGVFCWGKDSTTYAFGVAARQNPLNVYSSRIYYQPFTCEGGNGLEDWYNSEIEKFRAFWEDYIKKTYLNEICV